MKFYGFYIINFSRVTMEGDMIIVKKDLINLMIKLVRDVTNIMIIVEMDLINTRFTIDRD